MATYRTWVFEVDAPTDEFLRLMKRALVLRGLDLDGAGHYDFSARAWGARGYVKVKHHERGLEAHVKVKAGLFGSVEALEDALLSAGRAAQAEILFAEPRTATA